MSDKQPIRKHVFVVDDGWYDPILIAGSESHAWRLLQKHYGTTRLYRDVEIRKAELVRLSDHHLIEICGDDPDDESKNTLITAGKLAMAGYPDILTQHD